MHQALLLSLVFCVSFAVYADEFVSLTSAQREQNVYPDFGDPSAPEFSDSVRVYTTGGAILQWRARGADSALSRFLMGAPFELEKLKILHSDGVTFLDEEQAGEDAWDPSVQILPDGQKILYAGIMKPAPGNKNAFWPEDHWSRRTYAFHPTAAGEWVASRDSLFGRVSDQPRWVGHNYGHHFLSDGRVNYIFYERVTEERDGRPYKTEIFARKIENGTHLRGAEIPILKIPSTNPWPAARRADGGYLVEGPRPFKVGGKYLLSFSAGDYASDQYGIHLLWADRITGPYQPYLNARGDDLKDFGDEIERELPLTWGAGRAVFFEAHGEWWALFHGIEKSRQSLKDGRRDLFLTPVEIVAAPTGAPRVRLLKSR